MLVARLSRVTPGRPESDLGVVTITSRAPRRPDPKLQGRFDGHVVVGPAAERYEQHVHVDRWDTTRPAVELLAHVLDLAIMQQRGAPTGAEAWALDVDLVAYLAKGAEIARRTGQLPTGEAWLEAAIGELFTALQTAKSANAVH